MSLNRLPLSLAAAALLVSGAALAADPGSASGPVAASGAQPVTVAASGPAKAVEPAPSGSYVSDPAHSSVIWKVDHLGLSHYTARFTRMTATLDWNREHPERSSVVATIDPLSVQTDFPFPEREDFDKEIGTEERFLGAKPIRFVSKTVTVTDAHHATVAGDLTLRGETHPAVLAVTFNGSMARQPAADSAKIGFSAELTFKRSAWGLAPKIKSVGDEVTVIIETELQPPRVGASANEKPVGEKAIGEQPAGKQPGGEQPADGKPAR